LIKKLIFTFLILITFRGFSQNLTEKEFVILTFEMERNKDAHGTFVYYWVAELEKYENSDEYKKPEIFTIYLHEFYGSDQLNNCCEGKVSDPYTYTTASEFDFPENYSEYLTDLRKLVKSNRKKLQVIKKEWKKNHKEKVTVFGTAVRGKICECEFDGRNYLEKGDRISFPKGNFEILENYWTVDKRILIFKDFADFDYSNTSYRTRK
jgi:hypothetical protein